VTWIATGTGVAPFLSMTRALHAAGADVTSIRLLHGARTAAGLYFGAEFYGILGSNYVPCLSRSPAAGGELPADWNVYHGRLTELLRAEGCDPSRLYYLCGSASMVVDVRDLLVSLGVPFDNVYSEIYF
jgi:ferredoxin--NADP+ reductase